MKKLFRLGSVAAILLGVVAAAGYIAFSHNVPPRFTLSGSPSPAQPSPSGAVPARVARLCQDIAPPDKEAQCERGATAYQAACHQPKSTPGVARAGTWLVAAGSEAGMRVHEKFIDLQLPNEAVARTQQVAGGFVLSGSGNSTRVDSACIAVGTLLLHSVDTVPEMPLLDTSQRDPVIAVVLDAVDDPVATFRATGLGLPSDFDDGTTHRLSVPGEFTIHGVTRDVVAPLEGTMKRTHAELVGSFTLKLAEYGMEPPENPMAAVDPTVTIEIHIFLDRS